MDKLTAFLPCRAGSQRVPNKNNRSFTRNNESLLILKLRQLLSTSIFESVILSTDSTESIDTAIRLFGNDSRLRIHIRPSFLCANDTTTDKLIKYVIQEFTFDNLLWTHVTSPFMTQDSYVKAWNQFCNLSSINDSLVGVTMHKNFFVNESFEPINYSKTSSKWPFTQKLKPLYEINSSVFIASFATMEHYQDRIGVNPYMFTTNKFESIDIDTMEQFDFASKIYNHINYPQSII